MAVTLHLTDAQAEILGFALLTARRDQRTKLDSAGDNAAAGLRDRLARLDQVAAELDVAPVVPDAADDGLLALCAQLRDMQAGWQRLWDATPDDGPRTPADAALRRYARRTWPGTHRPASRRRPDPIAGLHVAELGADTCRDAGEGSGDPRHIRCRRLLWGRAGRRDRAAGIPDGRCGGRGPREAGGTPCPKRP